MMKYYNYEGFLTNISLLKCIVILYHLLHDLTLHICIVLDTRNEVDGDWVDRNWQEQDGKSVSYTDLMFALALYCVHRVLLLRMIQRWIL